jgi:hypothetical protein
MYYVFDRVTDQLVMKTSDSSLLRMFPSSLYEVVIY